MATVTIKEFAEVVGITVERLLSQLTEAGIAFSKEEDVITDEDKIRLLAHLKSKHDGLEVIPDVLTAIKQSDDLRELNGILTKIMSEQRTMGLIKGENLNVIAEAIVELVNNSDAEHELFGAAMLGRLAAVARGRENIVFDHASEVFSERPVSMEMLEERDERFYSSLFLDNVNESWLVDYCITEALSPDLADKTRKELFKTVLKRTGNVSGFLGLVCDYAKQIQLSSDEEVRIKRARRVYKTLVEIFKEWNGELGYNVGDCLAEFFSVFIIGKFKGIDESVMFDIADLSLSILMRMIELRFSYALQNETFLLIGNIRKNFGVGLWNNYLRESTIISSVQLSLLESALVLARQNKADAKILSIIVSLSSTKEQAATAIKKHFLHAKDLDSDIRNWWTNIGKVSSNRNVEHKVGNSEDQQIGALLIEVEASREVMEKLSRAVVPTLNISDPVLASTVTKAVSGYTEMSQIVRRLARMRKLSKTDMKGEQLEYNMLEHEMIGGHKSGVRMVKVVRDGIKKIFGQNEKMLVKPSVEPID